jgi:hypothetical protein
MVWSRPAERQLAPATSRRPDLFRCRHPAGTFGSQGWRCPRNPATSRRNPVVSRSSSGWGPVRLGQEGHRRLGRSGTLER